MRFIKDWRYLVYYIFTASVVAIMLAVEDFMEGSSISWSELMIDFILSIPLLTLLTFTISLISYPVILFLNRYFPWETRSLKRVIIEVSLLVLLVIFLSLVIYQVITFVRVETNFEEKDAGFEGFTLVLVMLFINFFMIFSFHEFIILSTDKAYLSDRTQILEKQNYLIKYEALKSQINPHFLFNSLNVLSSLIYTDTVKSDQFIQKFSDVFRYVLELNQENVVQVRQELKFLDSYLFLQKIRFGDSLVIYQELDHDVLEKYLPPLTLQLIIENAIKHNIVDKEETLMIDISSKGDELVITNNLQRRDNLRESTGIGQKNLVSKYELIGGKSPQFYIQDERYVVVIPLLDKNEW